MRFKEYLIEILDNPAQHTDFTHKTNDKGTKYENHNIKSTFTIDDFTYTVAFDRADENGWEIVFVLSASKNRQRMSFGVTDTGNELKVFASVKAIVFKFIKQYNPDMIFFAAKEPSRRKLYQRFVKLFSKMGWTSQTKERDGEEVYYLYNPNHKKQ